LTIHTIRIIVTAHVHSIGKTFMNSSTMVC